LALAARLDFSAALRCTVLLEGTDMQLSREKEALARELEYMFGRGGSSGFIIRQLIDRHLYTPAVVTSWHFATVGEYLSAIREVDPFQAAADWKDYAPKLSHRRPEARCLSLADAILTTIEYSRVPNMEATRRNVYWQLRAQCS
jgi:hypothetical protein